MKPRVFVGSSTEAIDVANAIQQNLAADASVNVWPQDVFKPTSVIIESLEKALEDHDFAVFVLQPDDKVVIRAEKKQVVRDDVIFEAGLFMGRYGRERVFLIAPTGWRQVRILSDLAGINFLQYDPPDTPANLRSVLGPPCTEIRNSLRHLRNSPEKDILNAIVINAREEFNEELINSLYRNLFDLRTRPRIRITEDMGGPQFGANIVNATREPKPDFLIIVPPSLNDINDSAVLKHLRAMMEEGTKFIFVENYPNDLQQFGDAAVAIQADHEDGARQLINEVIRLISDNNLRHVLLINAPEYHQTGNKRSILYQSALAETGVSVDPLPSNGWEKDKCSEMVSQYLNQRGNAMPDVIVCGNDTMAFGAVRAVMASPQISSVEKLPYIFGYDGLESAIQQIDEPWSPFYATVRLSPKVYGQYIANSIRQFLDPHPMSGSSEPQSNVIRIPASGALIKKSGRVVWRRQREKV